MPMMLNVQRIRPGARGAQDAPDFISQWKATKFALRDVAKHHDVLIPNSARYNTGREDRMTQYAMHKAGTSFWGERKF